jgi:F-type H+-transporting ATPase subunit a
MEKLEHTLWIVQAANAVFGPMVNRLLALFGIHVANPAEPIPNYLVMVSLIVFAVAALAFVVKSRLSVENPGKLQIVFEDMVGGLAEMLDVMVGPTGRNYLTLVGTIGVFILTGNLMGLIPGFMAPTSSINVTLGCAVTVWVYYHAQGIRSQGIVSYLKHFAVPPGAHWSLSIVWLPIEVISHFSRVLSLSVVRQHLR